MAQFAWTSLCYAKLLQLCLTLWDPMGYCLPGSAVHGILQTTVLELVAMFFSRGSSWTRYQTHVSCISCSGRQILYHWAMWEAPNIQIVVDLKKKEKKEHWKIVSMHPSMECLSNSLRWGPSWLNKSGITAGRDHPSTSPTLQHIKLNSYLSSWPSACQ